MASFDLFELAKSGGFTLPFILFCSLLVVTLAIERSIVMWGFFDRARSLADVIERCLRRGAWGEARSACERSSSPMAEVFLIGFERHGRSSRESLEAAVERERQRVTLQLRVRLWIIATIGALSPFVGLFGTVWGIMSAFNAIGALHQAGIDVVGPGIAEALVATAAGILVGIEAVVFFNYFQAKLHRLSIELKLLVEEFVELLNETEPEHSSASGRPAAEQATAG